jgi:flavin-dependent dehydrogenase
MKKYDVIVVGAGPAGATAGSLTARAGLSTLLLERAIFPRDKVCGDCLNPGCWEVFEELGVTHRVAALPQCRPRVVHFVDSSGSALSMPFGTSGRGMAAIRRRDLDQVLLNRAIELGAEVRFRETVQTVRPGWRVTTDQTALESKYLVAADGRNSTVARSLGHSPASRRDRIALQTHFSHRSEPHIALEIHQAGYVGRAMVSEQEMNLCLVCPPANRETFQQKAQVRFGLNHDHPWLTVAPLARKPIRSSMPGLFYVGDAGRVVEPFTGEGIFYALLTGRLAAQAILREEPSARSAAGFQKDSAQVYRGRLWINLLAKYAVLKPVAGDTLLRAFRQQPAVLQYLINRVLIGERNGATERKNKDYTDFADSEKT